MNRAYRNPPYGIILVLGALISIVFLNSHF